MTLNNVNIAAADQDLIMRAVAAASKAGIENPDAWVAQRRYKFVNARVNSNSEDTVESIYEYAKIVRDGHIAQTPPPPGLNIGAVTDDYIKYAVQSIIDEEGE